MAERLRWANRRRSEFTAYPAQVRLARLLVDLSDAYGERTADGLRVGAMISQLELATMIGVAEATRTEGVARPARRRTRPDHHRRSRRSPGGH
jgi:CRP-like cAMP-binding protein